MRLRPGVRPDDASAGLRNQAHPVETGGSVHNSGLQYIVNAFASWASDTEKLLCQLFVDPDLDELHTTRYWHIRDASPQSPRLSEMVWDEGAWQAARLRRIADELEGQVERLRGDPGAALAVVDTNVFLHCHEVHTFDWSFVGEDLVRVIVPIRVIEELDDRKRERRNSDVGNRARSVVRWLRETLPADGPHRATLGDGATIETYVPQGPRRLILSADTEILEVCETLETFTGKGVAIVTSDYGMELRGAASGFRVAPVPERHRLEGV
jgi:hypothetical protein